MKKEPQFFCQQCKTDYPLVTVTEHYLTEHGEHVSRDAVGPFPSREAREAWEQKEDRMAWIRERQSDICRHYEVEGVKFDAILRILEGQVLTAEQTLAVNEYDALKLEYQQLLGAQEQ